MSLKTLKEHEVSFTFKDNLKTITLNFTDITSNSNKFYQAEILETNDGKFVIYTNYGRTGGSVAKEYRVCNDLAHAEKEFEKIVKSKTKKGYQKIEVLKTDVGSDLAQAKIVADKVSKESLEKKGIVIEEEKSNLHPQVQDLVRTWFNITEEFIELNLDTKKCPLGQLSLTQLDKAKEILEQARLLIHAKKPDTVELNKLTNSYYSNIPHNFGYRKIDADSLRFDNDTKIDQAFDILDAFADAKNTEKTITKKSNIDDKYLTLNAELEWLDPEDATWKWIDQMFHQTRANNHHFLGKIKLHKVFKLKRKDEEKVFLANAERIAKECGKFNPSPVYEKLVKERPDVPKELVNLYKQANILPGWHGSRRVNFKNITKMGLLIRPSGIVHNGSAFGDAVYHSSNSTKAISYTDVQGSYWVNGSNKTAYLFLSDIALGNQKIASYSSFYTKDNIKPYHSVWAPAGKSSVINDEFMLYNSTGPQQQHFLKYVLEFETLCR